MHQEEHVTTPTSRDQSRCPIDFDHHSDYHAKHWAEVYERLRRECPRPWIDRYDGFWIATKYDDIMSISRRTDVISTEKTIDPETGEERGGVTIPTTQGA